MRRFWRSIAGNLIRQAGRLPELRELLPNEFLAVS
jgi:hypothetical protein